MCHLLPVLQMSSQFWYAEVDIRHSLLICCKILNSQLLLQWYWFHIWSFVRQTLGEAMEVVCKFFLLWSHNFNLHSNLNRSSHTEMFCKKMFIEILQNLQEDKITPWLTSHTRRTVCVSWLTNFCKGTCLFKSWLVHGLLVLLFYDTKKFIKALLRSS